MIPDPELGKGLGAQTELGQQLSAVGDTPRHRVGVPADQRQRGCRHDPLVLDMRLSFRCYQSMMHDPRGGDDV